MPIVFAVKMNDYAAEEPVHTNQVMLRHATADGLRLWTPPADSALELKLAMQKAPGEPDDPILFRAEIKNTGSAPAKSVRLERMQEGNWVFVEQAADLNSGEIAAVDFARPWGQEDAEAGCVYTVVRALWTDAESGAEQSALSSPHIWLVTEAQPQE